MKTILIPITTNFFSRNFLQTDAYEILKNRTDVRIVFLTPAHKRDYYAKTFPAANALFAPYEDFSDAISEKLFKFIEMSSIHTRTVTFMQYHDLFREGSGASLAWRVMVFVFGRLLWYLGKFRWWRNFIRAAYYFYPSHNYQKVFDEYKPALVLCPTLLYGENRILKEARRRGIKTVGLVHSWDNFYSKAMLRVHPDYLLVHAQSIAEDAARYGDYSSEHISIVGIPQYDNHVKRRNIMSRDEFFKRVGGNPSKKLIIYAFSGKTGLSIDYEVLELLHEAILRNEFGEDVQVLVRPYPRFDFSEQGIKALREKYGFLVESALAHTEGERRNNWEFDADALSFLASSLYHTDVVVNMYSTFFVEAALFDKPLVAVAFDGKRKRHYWNSSERFFEWEHLRALKNFNAIPMAYSPEELKGHIRDALRFPDRYKAERELLVRGQAEYLDGASGKRLAGALLELL